MAIYGLKNIAMRNMAMYCNTKFEEIWQYLYWLVYQYIFKKNIAFKILAGKYGNVSKTNF